jgi:hypothetical protein
MKNVTNPVSLPFTYFTQDIPLLHDRSNRTSPSFSNTTFKNFRGVSDLLSEASKFQHTKYLTAFKMLKSVHKIGHVSFAANTTIIREVPFTMR